MNFENVLNYQKADIEYRKLRKAINSDPNYRKMEEMRQAYEAAKQKNADSEVLATTLIKAYEDANAFIEKYASEIEQLCAVLNDENTEENEEKAALSRLGEIRDLVGEWEKKAAKLKADAEKAINDNTAAQVEGAKARKVYQDAKAAYEAVKKEKGGELDKKKADRDELRGKVEPELLEMYDKLIAGNIIPPFVRAGGTEKDPVCGCGLGLSQSKRSALVSDGYVTCDSCHRIIIK